MGWESWALTFGKAGTWSERAVLLSGGNKYCHHHREKLHLFNVPFRKWNPWNPTDMVTSWCITPFWNLIRAKTVYQYLEPDIYWKWPLVKVIAGPLRVFQMSLWSFCFVWDSKMYQPISWDTDRQPLKTEPQNTCGNFYKDKLIRKKCLKS